MRLAIFPLTTAALPLDHARGLPSPSPRVPPYLQILAKPLLLAPPILSLGPLEAFS